MMEVSVTSPDPHQLQIRLTPGGLLLLFCLRFWNRGPALVLSTRCPEPSSTTIPATLSTEQHYRLMRLRHPTQTGTLCPIIGASGTVPSPRGKPLPMSTRERGTIL